jgi:hypothetical protein
MTILKYLEQWKSTGAITLAQFDAIAALERRDRLSVFLELHTLLYVGVVAFVAGIGWTIQTYLARLGDLAILSALTFLLLSSLYYCFSRALPYSRDEVQSASFALDYVLYLGCLIFGIELGYLESQFHLLRDNWDNYLLMSAVVYFVLAYRFDNRFVLSLALSTLAGWFGLRLSHFPTFGESMLRTSALVYGTVVALAGTGLYRVGIKKHFLEAYLHIAANVLFVALASALFERNVEWLYVLGLLGLAAIAIVAGVRFKRFAFVVYGVGYGYIGISARVLHDIDSFTASLAYVVTSGTIVIGALVLLARRFGREE